MHAQEWCVKEARCKDAARTGRTRPSRADIGKTDSPVHFVQGGAEAVASGPDAGWALPLGAAVLGIRHVGLGGWQPQECMALENELGSWQSAGSFSEPEPALRSGSPGQHSVRSIITKAS